MRTRAAMIGVVAIGMAAAAAEDRAVAVDEAQAVPAAVDEAQAVPAAADEVRAVVRAAAVAQEALAAGVDAQVGSMPSAAMPICPGAIWPREAKAGC
jgi:hypothetical protein